MIRRRIAGYWRNVVKGLLHKIVTWYGDVLRYVYPVICQGIAQINSHPVICAYNRFRFFDPSFNYFVCKPNSRIFPEIAISYIFFINLKTMIFHWINISIKSFFRLYQTFRTSKTKYSFIIMNLYKMIHKSFERFCVRSQNTRKNIAFMIHTYNRLSAVN